MGTLSSIGRGYTYIKAIFYIFIAVIMFIIGVYMLIKERKTDAAKKIQYRRLGIFLIIISILIFLLALFEVYIVKHSNIAADVEGVEGIEEIVKVT